MSAPRLRRALFKVHSWLGGVMALVLVAVALTGVMLGFRAAFREPPVTVQPLPAGQPAADVSTILEQAVAAGDGSPATDVSIPQRSDAPWVVWLDDDAETRVYLDHAGRVVKTHREAGAANRTWMRWFFLLHTGELFGVAGQAASIASGVAIVVLTASGLAMLFSRWRPRRRRGSRSAKDPA